MNTSEKKLLNGIWGNAANNYGRSWPNEYVESRVDPELKVDTAWAQTQDRCYTINTKSRIGLINTTDALKSLVGDYDQELNFIDQIKEYCRRDVMMTYEFMTRSNIFNSYLGIKKVIFNDPATIVLWKDGTKTIVKCTEADTYDEEKGLAMAIIKKLYGNNNSFHKIFKKNVPNNDTKHEESVPIKEDVSLKIGDTVSIYDSKKYDGIFNGKQGTVKVIRSYRDHVCVGLAIDDYWNPRQINGYYLFDIRKLRKVTK